MSGSVDIWDALEASNKSHGGVSPCSSSGGVTKTFGTWSELNEGGGAIVRPVVSDFERNECRLSIVVGTRKRKSSTFNLNEHG